MLISVKKICIDNAPGCSIKNFTILWCTMLHIVLQLLIYKPERNIRNFFISTVQQTTSSSSDVSTGPVKILVNVLNIN